MSAESQTFVPTPPRLEKSTQSSPIAAEAASPPAVAGYELLGEVARGGMGVVYRARDLKLGRIVALKMILAGAHAGPEDLARFRTEAEAVAQLQHPNIVQLFEIGEQDGLPYFALEFVDGGSLAQRLHGDPLSPRQSAELVETLARAMQYAHERGIIHRDLKPANILLHADRPESVQPETSSGTGASDPLKSSCNLPKITDFGLAKRLDVEGGQTLSGAIIGTPSYMSPEQAAGKTREIGPAADIYALGAILYELLTGRPPFRAPARLDTILQVIADEPIMPRLLQRGVPRDLETICCKCLEKAPGKRYASAGALADDLRRFLADEPILARPAGIIERANKFTRRNRALVLGAAAVVVTLLAGAAVAAWWAAAATEQRNLAVKAERDKEVLLQEKSILLAQSYAQLGKFAMQRGEWRKARGWIEKALEAGEEDEVGLLLDRVKTLIAVYDTAGAAQAIDELSSRGDLGAFKGLVLLWQGDMELGVDNVKAARLVKEALAVGLPDPDAAYARALLASTSLEAVNFLEKTLAADPLHHQANSVLALVLILLGRLDMAQERVVVAEHLFPEDPTFKVYHAIISALKGDRERAIALIKISGPAYDPQTADVFLSVVEVIHKGRELSGVIMGEPYPIGFIDIFNLVVKGRRLFAGGQARQGDGAPVRNLRVTCLPPLLAQSWGKLITTLIPGFPAGSANAPVDPFGSIAKILGGGTNIREAQAASVLGEVARGHHEGTLHYLRGCMLFNLNRYAEAEAAFTTALETPSLFGYRRGALLGASVCQGVLASPTAKQPRVELRPRIRKNLRELLTLKPLPLDLTLLLSRAALSAEDIELSRLYVDEAQRRAPNSLAVLRRRVSVEFRAGAYGPMLQAAARMYQTARLQRQMAALGFPRAAGTVCVLPYLDARLDDVALRPDPGEVDVASFISQARDRLRRELEQLEESLRLHRK